MQKIDSIGLMDSKASARKKNYRQYKHSIKNEYI